MSKALKVVSIVWLLICISLAVLGVSQSHGGNPEGGIAPAIFVTFLTVPLGLIPMLGLPAIWGSNSSIGLVGDILMYAAMIGIGYWQWFILLPKLIRKIKHEKSPKALGLVLVVLIAILYGLYRFY